jgi:hypothetical protein
MNRICVVLILSASLALHSIAASAYGEDINGRVSRNEIDAAGMQSISDHLREKLQIIEQVEVTLVDHNPLVLSVETRSGRSGPFTLSIDREFVATLTPDELEAAIAHELGHVWIYTHHPYLQTERLANDIALRVVSRSMLQPVYEKVWKRTGIKGNLVELIGEP